MPAAAQNGTDLFQQALRKEQDKLTTIIHSAGEGIVGRVDGEITFPDDVFMSPVHAQFAVRDGQVFLIDEILTPDSSRFWPAESYQPGMSPPSFDKQFVRDYLETLDWNKTPPGPRLHRRRFRYRQCSGARQSRQEPHADRGWLSRGAFRGHGGSPAPVLRRTRWATSDAS